MAFCFVNPYRQFHSITFLTDYLNGFSFILKLLAFIFDFGSHGEPWGNFGLLGVDNLEVLVIRFLNTNAGGFGCEVPDFDGYLIILVNLDLLEHNFRRYNFQRLILT